MTVTGYEFQKHSLFVPPQKPIVSNEVIPPTNLKPTTEGHALDEFILKKSVSSFATRNGRPYHTLTRDGRRCGALAPSL